MNIVEVTQRDSEPLAMLLVAPLQIYEQQVISFVVEPKSKVLETRLPPAAKGNLEYLADVIRDEFIVPSLTTCNNRIEYLRFWTKNAREFNETVRAYKVLLGRLLRESSLGVLAEMRWETLKQDIEKTLAELAGSEASVEFDFCFSTAERTNRFITKFASMGEPTDRARDQALLGEYARSSLLFMIGMFSFADIASGLKPRNEEILEEVFAFARQGALCSYAAAREAYSLRQAEGIPDKQVEEHFFDADEDVDLANATLEDVGRIAKMCEHRDS